MDAASRFLFIFEDELQKEPVKRSSEETSASDKISANFRSRDGTY